MSIDIKEFRNLVTNRFMPDFDYVQTKVSFQTVFYISDFSYCCCTCGYEHEYLDYISDSGEINEEMYLKIVKCITEGKCPHVDEASPNFIAETGFHAINIATAVGTERVLNDKRNFYSFTNCKKSLIFHIGPLEIWFLKNKHELSISSMKHFANSHSFQLTKHLGVQRLDTKPCRIKLAFETILEMCIKKGNKHLVRKCLLSDTLGCNPAAAFNLTCPHKKELKTIQSVVIKRYKGWKELDHLYLTKCCRIAILHNDSKLLKKILMFIPAHTKRWLAGLYIICNVLQQKKCQAVLKRRNIPMLRPSSFEEVNCMLSLLEYSHASEKAMNTLSCFSGLSDIVRSEGDFKGTFLHYYIRKIISSGSDCFRGHGYISTGHDQCSVIKSLIDYEPENLMAKDGQGLTPLMLLLSKPVKFLPIVRQIAEVLIYENPDIEKEIETMLYAMERDQQVITQGTRLNSPSALHYYSFLKDSFVPDLATGFLMDAGEHGLFGYEDECFAFNFFVPLLIESGFKMSATAKEIYLSKTHLLHPAVNSYVTNFITTPKLLTLCCRDTLRTTFKGRQLHRYVEETDMPQKLRDFILLRGLLKCVPVNSITRCTNFFNWR